MDAPSKRSVTLETKLKVIEILRKKYPDARCALNYDTPFQLLIATILSAQCTDERVNKVTAQLFKKYPDSESLSQAPLEEIEKHLQSVNFFKNKSKNIIQCSQTLGEKYHHIVPQNLDQLIELAGVGRKTANVVLGNAFNIASGIVVDTHVARLSFRLGWTRQTEPEKIEKDLLKFVPKKDWIQLSHFLILHGRAICKARSPQCEKCFLIDQCPKLMKNKDI